MLATVLRQTTGKILEIGDQSSLGASPEQGPQELYSEAKADTDLGGAGAGREIPIHICPLTFPLLPQLLSGCTRVAAVS